jgi:DNA-binding LacI/PurR family transcriptional regulator
MEILEHVVDSSEPVTPAQIGERTSIPPATVTRTLAKLVDQGFLRRVGHGQYAPGQRLRRLASSGDRADGLKGRTLLFLQLFTASYDEIYLGIADVLLPRQVQCIVHPLHAQPGRSDAMDRSMPVESPAVFYYSQWKPWAEVSPALGMESLPAVRIGYSGYDACTTVCWDEQWAFETITDRLLRHGCRTVVYLGAEQLHGWDHSVRFRHAGYLQAMGRAGVEPQVVLLAKNGGNGRQAEERIRELASGPGGPVGLVSVQFSHLPALLAGLEARGVAMNDRLLAASALKAGDAEHFPETIGRLWAHVREPWREVGRAAARELLGVVRDEHAAGRRVLLRPALTCPVGSERP